MRYLTRSAPNGRQHERGSPPPTRGSRSSSFALASYDASARTVEAILSAGTRVRRYFGYEELEVSPTAVDLSRADAGRVPLLNAHQQFDVAAVLGTLEHASIRGGQLIGLIRFADTVAGREAEGMVARGELRGVSIGYLVRTWQITEDDTVSDDVWRAVSWELMEVSLVPIPADPAAGFRAADRGNHQEEDDVFTRNQPGGASPPGEISSQNSRDSINARSITSAARNAGLDLAAVDEMLARHEAQPFTRESMVAEIGRRYAALDTPTTTVNRHSVLPSGNGGALTVRMQDALFARMSGTAPTDHARDFMGVSMTGMARALLQDRGDDVRFLSDNSVMERAMSTTSDFPALLLGSGNRYLVATFEAAASPLKALARERSAPDFRELSVLQLSNAPTLDKVGEAGEIQYGSFAEGRETYRVATFAKIFALSRQAIINDDLGAFTNALALMARAAAETEAQELAALLNANGGLGPKMADGKTLFHADHANLAQAPGALSVATLSDGRRAMRDQKDVDKATFINAVPRTLLVGSANETLAEQVLTAIDAQKPTDVNPFGGKLDVAVDPRLASNGWRLFANPAQAAVLEYAYLNGFKGPQLEQRPGWTVLGTEFRVVNDFGCGAVDSRGAYMNAGA